MIYSILERAIRPILILNNHLVSIHDKTVDRTTNGKGRVDGFTLEELQKLDAAYHFKDLNGKYKVAISGGKDEVLKFVSLHKLFLLTY